MKKCFVLLFFTFSIEALVAQNNLPPVYKIKNDTALNQYLDNNYWQLLEDKAGKWTLEQVIRSPLTDKFHKRGTVIKGIDTLANTYWIRYRLENRTDRESKISLESCSEREDFYILNKEGEWKHFVSGDLVPWEEKSGLKGNNIIPIALKSGEELLVYKRINNRKTGFPANFFINFSNTEKRIQADYISYVEDRLNIFNYRHLLEMFLEGLLVLSIFYNLFFFRVTREKEYLYFSLFLFFLASGRLNNTLAAYSSWYNPRLSPLAGYLSLSFGFLQFFLLQFIRHFFKTYLKYPTWDKVLLATGILSAGVFILFTFMDPFFTFDNTRSPIKLSEAEILNAIAIFFVLITFFLYLKKKDRVTKLVIIAGFPLMLFWATTYLIHAVHIWSLGSSYRTIEVACTSWFVLFFSLILFIRFNNLRKENAEQALDNERLAKEKEMERSQLIALQKIELEKEVAARTAELKESLESLKSTQAQLIQSEKMASLGELTAGIAHEIQNPLNFVNNFSEVNTELVDEMEEALQKNNKEEAIAIAEDLKENLQKINHHGKRADSIVKGMLQHSRASAGKKEPTDINVLADEYLRLSFHGMRAKDRSLNAIIETDFDESIGKIEVIPQDIGRVLLNLLNNAFYAVKEKKKRLGAEYEPTVLVSTKKLNDKIEVRVNDNGMGIPQNAIAKIFQPFFTTKPTGQGTGLGLSLSYEIIKAHGGEIKVETKEDRGTEFVIRL